MTPFSMIRIGWALISLTIALWIGQPTLRADVKAHTQCIACPTDLKKVIRLCWKVEALNPKPSKSEERSGEGWGGPLDPLELYKKIHVKPDFLESDHGQISFEQCHVSRPDNADGGLFAASSFIKTPVMDTTCASCPGGRVHGEYTGVDRTYAANFHYADQEMDCLACRISTRLHASAAHVASRFELPEMIKKTWLPSPIL